MKIYTIGFTQRTAENFFETVRQSGAREVVDVRLRSTSQLSGFAKVPDLPYFLSRICSVGFRDEPRLAPTAHMLDSYKKKSMSWDDYAAEYMGLITSRFSALAESDFDGVCLLCSEHLPHKCHRRLAAEFMKSHFGDGVEIVHL